MRYAPDHKERSREKILTSASQLLRRDGIEAVSLASAMKHAGMTHGAFYAHFESKDDLVAESIRYSLNQTIARLRAAVSNHPNDPPLRVIVNSYLTESHLRNAWNGCATASLGQQAARSSPRIKSAMADRIDALVNFIAEQYPSDLKTARRAKALALYSTMVGAIVLAMNYDSIEHQQEILNAAKATILLAVDSDFGHAC